MEDTTNYLFHISKKVWKDTCNMYFKISSGSLRNYLQFYPFSKMTWNDKQYLMNYKFYSKYIKNGAIVQFTDVMRITDNYLLKKDGSFRDATLLSPILFLVLQAIGKEISLKYQNTRSTQIATYYSGNYSSMNAKYSKEYSYFYRECKRCATKYDYFIKTDISSFFVNINVDKLIEKIKVNCNDSVQLNQLKIYKEFLQYCGKGRFPLVENSIASSYLATVVYLNDSDNRLVDYLTNNLNIADFKIVRYVDDLYIFSNEFDIRSFHKIRNKYSSYLKKEDLAINSEKTKFLRSDELENEIKTSFYGEDQIEIVDDSDLNLNNIGDRFLQFLKSLNDLLADNELDYKEYKKINSRATSVYQDPYILSELSKLIAYDDFFWVDPKRLFIMFLNTKDGKLIKPILSMLGKKKAEEWTFYDLVMAITYLTHRRTSFRNFYSHIYNIDHNLATYLDYDYTGNFKSQFESVAINNLITVTDADITSGWISYYLYFESIIEYSKNNILTSYAFFKNYFDENKRKRMKRGGRKGKGSIYSGYYKKQQLQKVYRILNKQNETDEIISKANDLRNDNPLSHAAAQLLLDIDNPSEPKTEELIATMRSLFKLLVELCNYYINKRYN
ncbi:AbiA family abortive infection protein [Lactobacillus helveticus]|uniref:AbiA family abortive infection protein n=1 Tax=Lactobacillus helveticus TaxID=1587 RepID=UPI000D7BD4FD|nr:AbiA family abortive infection protein [Lactobacillus helveticus]MCT3409038.1 AbiA family abortive infection protein [Lactobacillus helveticus]PXZ18373.1 hypothetical protein DM475_08590 [Lactobacillus helveticus]